MRLTALALCFAPTLLCAEIIPVASPVTHVTLYPEGGTVERVAIVALPQGEHEIILTDIPANVDLTTVRVTLDGARIGSLTMRQNYVPPRDADTPDIDAAEARIRDIEARLQAVRDDAAQARLAAGAAEAQIAFLTQLGSAEGIAGAGAENLRQITRMIGEEALAARQSAHAAQIEGRRIERAFEDLAKELKEAQAALDALVPEVEDRAYVSIKAGADAPTEATLKVSYLTDNAEWEPVYDLTLNRGTNPTVTLDRGAVVYQDTGENWENVTLTLSTVTPASNVEPGILLPQRRRIEDPAPAPSSRAFGAADILAEPAPAMEAPVIIDYAVSSDLSGYALVYRYPLPVNLAAGADNLRLKLDTLTTGAVAQAKAVPIRDETAFLVAQITNDTGEQILPSSWVSLYVDETFVGTTGIDGIAAGAEAELPFGPIDGLRLKRVVLNRNEGDRGLISRSNAEVTEAQIEVDNLTGDTWELRVLDRVPYSEQEDLAVTWNATPKPSEENVDNLRGILGWDLTLPPGDKQVIRLEQTLTWPDGKLLR